MKLVELLKRKHDTNAGRKRKRDRQVTEYDDDIAASCDIEDMLSGQFCGSVRVLPTNRSGPWSDGRNSFDRPFGE